MARAKKETASKRRSADKAPKRKAKGRAPAKGRPRRRGDSGYTNATAEARAKIVDLLGRGLFREVASRAVGVAPRTLRDWIQRGREQIEATEEFDRLTRDGLAEGVERPVEDEFAEFARAVWAAESAHEAAALLTIQAAGVEDWRAEAWFLERRYPKRYAKSSIRVEAERVDTANGDDAATMFEAKLQIALSKFDRIEGDGDE